MGSPAVAAGRNRIFISYSRKDRAWLERLQPHLKALEHYGIESWADTRLEAGDVWLDEIRQAIASARVAILLVSADFLASDFIENEELPQLLANAEAEGATVMPVILSPCLYKETKSISRFMSVNDPAEPLEKLNDYERNLAWLKLSQTILKVLQEGAASYEGPEKTEPAPAKPIPDQRPTPGPVATPEQAEKVPTIGMKPEPGAPEETDRRFALLVTNDNFSAVPTLSKLAPRFNEPPDLEGVLARKDIGGFKVTSLRNESFSNVSQAIQAFFANREPDDVLFLYYSGIGLWYSGWGGLLGFAAADTQPDEIETTVPAYVLQGAAQVPVAEDRGDARLPVRRPLSRRQPGRLLRPVQPDRAIPGGGPLRPGVVRCQLLLLGGRAEHRDPQ